MGKNAPPSCNVFPVVHVFENLEAHIIAVLMHNSIIITASSYVSCNIIAPLEYKSHLTELL